MDGVKSPHEEKSKPITPSRKPTPVKEINIEETSSIDYNEDQ